MRINENIAISTPSILLVPYDPHHVETYHEWMSDPHIQAATASEPLTLEEEHSNQGSWRTAGDKLTFIVCRHLGSLPGDERPVSPPSSSGELTSTAAAVVAEAEAGKCDAPHLMVGDVNLFLHAWHPEEEDEHEDGGFHQHHRGHGHGHHRQYHQIFDIQNGTPTHQQQLTTGGHASTSAPPPTRYVVGEIDIMIAHPENRGKGVGKAAVKAFLCYVLRNLDAVLGEYYASTFSPSCGHKNAHENIDVDATTDIRSSCSNGVACNGAGHAHIIPWSGKQHQSTGRKVVLRELVAKIQASNHGSQALFKSLGFEKRGEANYFGELELVLSDLGRLEGLVEEGYEEVVYERP